MACGGNLLLVAAVGVLLAAATVQAQTQFELLDERETELEQSPELLEFAAGFGERVVIEITGQQDVLAPLSEQVNAVLDCLPWLMMFPGGSIAWYIQRLDNVNGEVIEAEQPFTDRAGRVRIEGEFDRYLNITRTLVESVSADPTAGIYRCEVCIGPRPEPPEMPAPEDCHSVNTTLFPVGQPPFLDKADNNTEGPVSDTEFTRAYRIGADFCLHDPPAPLGTPTDDRTDPSTSLEIRCALLNEDTNQELMLGEAFPTPDRTWYKDGVLIYTARLGDPGVFSDEFRNNPATSPLADPDFGLILQPDGDIRIRTDLNVSVPASVQAYQAAFGNYTCRVNNSLGEDMATSILRRCGIPPVTLPCPEPEPVVITPRERVIPIPCDVCVLPDPPLSQWVQLNCTPVLGDSPLNYVWRFDNEVVLSGVNASMLLADDPGNYTCTVDNIDGTAGGTSTVYFSSTSAEFTFSIITEAGQRPGNGCDRLRGDPPVELESDICLFVGDDIVFNCTTNSWDNSVPGFVVGPRGRDQDGQFIDSVTLNDTGTVSCEFTDPQCGTVSQSLQVQVYDPARIDREVDLPPETPRAVDTLGISVCGAGRNTEMEQIILVNDTVMLYCPTTGSPDPTTSWRRLVLDERRMLVEQRVEPGGDISISTTPQLDGIDTLVLTIMNFSPDDSGTYVCRTKNIAGIDAGNCVLRTDPDTFFWFRGEFSECDPDCHRGYQTRLVVCRSRRTNLPRPDSDCTGERPASRVRCINSGPCLLDPIWRAFEWGSCSRGCAGGFRWRKVVCFIPRTEAIVADEECFEQTKPPMFEFCFNRCCIEDFYPTNCRANGPYYCGDPRFQQYCCWTCRLKDIP